jgi:hypothetical protein
MFFNRKKNHFKEGSKKMVETSQQTLATLSSSIQVHFHITTITLLEKKTQLIIKKMCGEEIENG